MILNIFIDILLSQQVWLSHPSALVHGKFAECVFVRLSPVQVKLEQLSQDTLLQVETNIFPFF